VPAAIPKARFIAAKPAIYVYDNDIIQAAYAPPLISQDGKSASIAIMFSSAALKKPKQSNVSDKRNFLENGIKPVFLNADEIAAAAAHEIMHHLVNFNPYLKEVYRPLYKNTAIEAMRHLSKELDRKLTKEEKEIIEGELTADRGMAALMGDTIAAKSLFSKIEISISNYIDQMFAYKTVEDSRSRYEPLSYTQGEWELRRAQYHIDARKNVALIHPCIHLRNEALDLITQRER
jgi:Zn-dependent protease with chaperone function